MHISSLRIDGFSLSIFCLFCHDFHLILCSKAASSVSWSTYSDAKEEHGRNIPNIHQPRHTSCEFCTTHCRYKSLLQYWSLHPSPSLWLSLMIKYQYAAAAFLLLHVFPYSDLREITSPTLLSGSKEVYQAMLTMPLPLQLLPVSRPASP